LHTLLKLLWIPLLCSFAWAQGGGIIGQNGVLGPNGVIVPGSAAAAAAAISIDASCTGNDAGSGPIAQGCSAPMTVTAGDSIECECSTTSSSPMAAFITDNVNNVTYDNIEQLAHPNSTHAGTLTAVLPNSLGGSITPQCVNWENANINISCRALLNTRVTKVVDGGAVNQIAGVTGANPTSGTAAAPTNNNEIVIGQLVLPAPQTVTNVAGWLPTGTLTSVGASSRYPFYDHTQIQTTATAVNSPFTTASVSYLDTQFAILNFTNPAGFRGFTGLFGVPAISKGNGVTVTAGDLNGATTTLTTVPANATGWSLNSGTGGTYNTAINPTGTGSILLQGTTHTFGDAGTSITLAAGDTTTNWVWGGQGANSGSPQWLSFFFRIGSTGIANGQLCDVAQMVNGATELSILLQAQYSSTNHIHFIYEPSEGGNGSDMATNLSTDTDYWLQMHQAGVNDRNHQFLVYNFSSPLWTLAQTFNYDILCTPSGSPVNCSTPAAIATTTGTASSGSTALTVASGTGIVVGQVVLGAGIPDPSQGGAAWTTVTVVAGTAVTLSQNTTGALSGTTVNFYNPPHQIRTVTNGSASSNSTALTIVAPTYSTITVGDPVGGLGIQNGTVVAAVAGTAVTLSLPTTSAISAGTGLTFWQVPNGMGFNFGKFSSCSLSAAVTLSAWTYDPFNDWRAFAPN
jgi:hypothetical protein